MTTKQPKRKPEKNRRLRAAITAFFALGSLVSIVYLYYSGLQVWMSVAIALIVLVVTGQVIATANGLDGSYGVYMLKSRRGLKFIDSLAGKGGKFWNAMAEWGAVLSFGLLSYLIFKREISKKMLLLGMLSITAMVLVVFPNTELFLSFLNIPGINLSGFGGVGLLQVTLSWTLVGLLAISIFGGVLFFMIALLGLSASEIAYSIMYAVSRAVATGNPSSYASLSSQVPGIAPIIPGLTIPLFSGVLALAVVLVVHEFSHGVLARIAKIRLKSMGILPFGIIPVGAFVEPDEKQVEKLDKKKQNSIFVAGISSNFLMTFLFFALTALTIIYVMPAFFKTGVTVAYTMHGYPAYNVIKPGSVLLRWNGHPVSNTTSIEEAAGNFTPFALVSVNTSNGNYTFRTNATGRIGVVIQNAQMPKVKGPLPGIIGFIYSFFVISFVLNFFVGGMNLLPLPAFDGWRIYKNRIKSKKKLRIIGWAMVIALIILLLPWIWIL